MSNKLTSMIDAVTSPKAFSTYAAIGVGVTVVLAILNTRKQCKIENEKKAQEEYLEKELTREDVKEEVQETLNTYTPTIVSALATIYCINKAENGWMNYSGLLDAAWLAAERRSSQVASTTPGLIAAAVYEGIRNKNLEEDKKWFYIPAISKFPDLYFQTTEAKLWRALYTLNKNYTIRGSASLREFLSLLNVLDQFDDPETRKIIREEGDYFGWNADVQLEDEPDIIPWIEFRCDTVVSDEGIEVIRLTPDIWTYPPFHSEDRLAHGYVMHPCE